MCMATAKLTTKSSVNPNVPNIPIVLVGANCTGICNAEGTNEGSTALMHHTWQ